MDDYRKGDRKRRSHSASSRRGSRRSRSPVRERGRRGDHKRRSRSASSRRGSRRSSSPVRERGRRGDYKRRSRSHSWRQGSRRSSSPDRERNRRGDLKRRSRSRSHSWRQGSRRSRSPVRERDRRGDRKERSRSHTSRKGSRRSTSPVRERDRRGDYNRRSRSLSSQKPRSRSPLRYKKSDREDQRPLSKSPVSDFRKQGAAIRDKKSDREDQRPLSKSPVSNFRKQGAAICDKKSDREDQTPLSKSPVFNFGKQGAAVKKPATIGTIDNFDSSLTPSKLPMASSSQGSSKQLSPCTLMSPVYSIDDPTSLDDDSDFEEKTRPKPPSSFAMFKANLNKKKKSTDDIEVISDEDPIIDKPIYVSKSVTTSKTSGEVISKPKVLKQSPLSLAGRAAMKKPSKMRKPELEVEYTKQAEEIEDLKRQIAELTRGDASKQSSVSSNATSFQMGKKLTDRQKEIRKQEVIRNLLKDGINTEDSHIANLMENISMDSAISWDKVVGLATAKSLIQESVVLPVLRADIFRGIRSPPKGIMLFGPPGTGKTLIAKAIASEWGGGAIFLPISASTITSKWVGEGEKNVKALFQVAKAAQPSIIFLDEMESLLSVRPSSSSESSSKIKTEFLIQMNLLFDMPDCRILFIGATNRPYDIDEAFRRRLEKRLYIRLPDKDERKQMILMNLADVPHTLSDLDVEEISRETEFFSGADIKALVTHASVGPFRGMDSKAILEVDSAAVPPVTINHFKEALTKVKPSVSQRDVRQHNKFNNEFGLGANN